MKDVGLVGRLTKLISLLSGLDQPFFMRIGRFWGDGVAGESIVRRVHSVKTTRSYTYALSTAR